MKIGVTGHRDVPNADLSLHLEIEHVVRALGPATWNLGLCRGADTWVGQAILDEQEYYGFLPFPVEIFNAKWSIGDKAMLRTMIKHCKDFSIASNSYCVGAYAKRNKQIVDASDEMFAIWDGRKCGGTFNTVQMAIEAKKPIWVLDPVTLEFYMLWRSYQSLPIKSRQGTSYESYIREIHEELEFRGVKYENGDRSTR